MQASSCATIPRKPWEDCQPIEPEWKGETVTILASGPSLDPREVRFARSKSRVIAVCDTWRYCLDADILYAADWPWWIHWDGVPFFRGRRWTQSEVNGPARHLPENILRLDFRFVRGNGGQKLSLNPSVIHHGGNSGFQALNIAVLLGAERICLLGFDMSAGHAFPDRPEKFNKKSDYSDFAQSFIQASKQVGNVVNCSATSKLNCFPRMSIYDALN